MKEMGKRAGVYAKWHPPHEHYGEMARFFSDVAKTIGRCGIEGFGAITRLQDLQRFNAEKCLSLQPYPLAAYGGLIALYNRHPHEAIELFFDRVEKVQSKLCQAGEYADTDQHYAGDFDQIQMIPVNKCYTAKDVLPLQAADFLAWEWRKSHIDRSGWWDQDDKPDGWDEKWADFEAWMAKENPRTRKSLLALLERTNFTGLIWDYEKLCEAHKARGGVWSLATSE
jgi:hypothetical protein